MHEARIDIANWHDLSQPGRYSIRADWRLSAGWATRASESNVVTIALVPPEQADVVELIYRATLITKNGASERKAQCRLVEIGEAVVPAVIEWLELEGADGGPNGGWDSYGDMIDVLSQIGSPRVRVFLTPSRAHGGRLTSEPYRAILLGRVEVWQGADRFEELIAVLDGPHRDRKWAIFKLGILGDVRAIGPLGRIAVEADELDIRETAKDALAHLRDPNVPMRYIQHQQSQDIELMAAASLHVGEPVKIRCKVTGGRYGSRSLVEFSKALWHFLPWGFAGPDPNPGQPLCLAVDRKQDRRYDEVHPVRQLRARGKGVTGGNAEMPAASLDVAELGAPSVFTLKPGESRLYESADIRQAFDINEPGEYRVHVTSSGYVLSDFLSFTILPVADVAPGQR